MSPADIAGDADILAVRATEFGRWVLDRCALDGDCWRWKSSTNNAKLTGLAPGKDEQ